MNVLQFLAGQVLEVSLAVGLVAALFLLLRPLLAKRYRAKACYWVWLVLALRLVIPLNPSLSQAPVQLTVPDPVLVYRAETPEKVPATVQPIPGSQVQVTQPVPGSQGQTGQPAPGSQGQVQPVKPVPEFQFQNPDRSELPQSVSYRPALTLAQLAAILWAVGVGGFLAVQLLRCALFRRRVRRWRQPWVEGPVMERFRSLRAELGVRTLTLEICPAAPSPLVTGFFRPVLLLPSTDYTDEELDAIFRHELVHAKRRDLWYKLLLLLARAIHWFNPLVHLMARRAEQDLEISCDEAVVAGRDAAFQAGYGRAVLSAAEAGLDRSAPLTTHFKGGKAALKERLAAILGQAGRHKGVVLVCAVVLLAAVIAGACAVTGQAEPSPTPSPTPAPALPEWEPVGADFDGAVSAEDPIPALMEKLADMGISELEAKLTTACVSPDGRWVAYTYGAHWTYWDLFLLDTTTGEEKRLVEDDFSRYSIHQWLDNDHLLCDTPRAQGSGLVVLDTEGNEITPDFAFDDPHILGIRDRIIAYESWAEGNVICFAEFNGTETLEKIGQIALGGSLRVQGDPPFSPDGTRFAYILVPDGAPYRRDLAVYDLRTGTVLTNETAPYGTKDQAVVLKFHWQDDNTLLASIHDQETGEYSDWLYHPDMSKAVPAPVAELTPRPSPSLGPKPELTTALEKYYGTPASDEYALFLPESWGGAALPAQLRLYELFDPPEADENGSFDSDGLTPFEHTWYRYDGAAAGGHLLATCSRFEGETEEYLSNLWTDLPGVGTGRGVAVGSGEAALLAAYPQDLYYLTPEDFYEENVAEYRTPPDFSFDWVYVWQPYENNDIRQLTFFLKDGLVTAIEADRPYELRFVDFYDREEGLRRTEERRAALTAAPPEPTPSPSPTPTPTPKPEYTIPPASPYTIAEMIDRLTPEEILSIDYCINPAVTPESVVSALKAAAGHTVQHSKMTMNGEDTDGIWGISFNVSENVVGAGASSRISLRASLEENIVEVSTRLKTIWLEDADLYWLIRTSDDFVEDVDWDAYNTYWESQGRDQYDWYNYEGLSYAPITFRKVSEDTEAGTAVYAVELVFFAEPRLDIFQYMAGACWLDSQVRLRTGVADGELNIQYITVNVPTA